MEHEDVLEQLELAAVEPGGLERLTAGDTPAAAVAGHLAGCAECSEELRRLGLAAPILRDVVRTTPPVDLRERTLAFVRQHGQARGAGATAGSAPAATGPVPVFRPAVRPAAAASDASGSGSVSGPRPIARPTWSTRVMPWVATLAAAVVLSVAATSFLVGRQLDDRLAAQGSAIEGLEAVTLATIGISAGDDIQRVSLAATDGGDANGSLLFSPSTTKLVVVADGLARPPEGREYRCWLEADGERTPVGKMFFADELAYWVGDTPGISDVGPGTTFGVSLTDVGGSSLEADPVIVGQL